MAGISRMEAEARGLLCKSHLRQERLKPAPGQLPAGEVWFGRGWAPVYDRALCVPVKYHVPVDAIRLSIWHASMGASAS